jgi:short-subunit dehydrogenase
LDGAAPQEEMQSLTAPNFPNEKISVLITGATGGLGKAFAVECASRGWNLFLTDVHPEALEMLAYMLSRTYGIHVLQHACDLTESASRTELFEFIRATQRQFRFLINVAGLDFEGSFRERAREEIRTIVRLNIEGTLEMTRELLELHTPHTPFHILNVASAAAFSPMPLKAIYAASKRFLLDFTIALREEVRSDGVTVTALCPAGMPTVPETIDAIERQGWLGLITTQNIGTVVDEALDAALQGKPMVIPGFINRQLKRLILLIPTLRLVSLLGRRWESARRRMIVVQA